MAKYETTPERRANLVKLARFLFTEPIEPSQFDMGCFNNGGVLASDVIERRCGTAGCAIGWAPNAGVPLEPNDDYDTLCDRELIEMADMTGVWMWCFGWYWDHFDNTPKGAGKRILWLLVKGLPEDCDEQRCGKAPLCYADWQPTEADWAAAAVSP